MKKFIKIVKFIFSNRDLLEDIYEDIIELVNKAKENKDE